jgi:hypothetical protein
MQRTCPHCGKLIRSDRQRLCDNCGEDFTIAPGAVDELRRLVADDPRSSLSELLEPFVGRTIGINASNAEMVEPAELIRVRAEYFSVAISGLVANYPYQSVQAVLEAPGGSVRIGGKTYPLVIRLDPLPGGKSGWGVGLLMPLG